MDIVAERRAEVIENNQCATSGDPLLLGVEGHSARFLVVNTSHFMMIAWCAVENVKATAANQQLSITKPDGLSLCSTVEHSDPSFRNYILRGQDLASQMICRRVLAWWKPSPPAATMAGLWARQPHLMVAASDACKCDSVS